MRRAVKCDRDIETAHVAAERIGSKQRGRFPALSLPYPTVKMMRSRSSPCTRSKFLTKKNDQSVLDRKLCELRMLGLSLIQRSLYAHGMLDAHGNHTKTLAGLVICMAKAQVNRPLHFSAGTFFSSISFRDVVHKNMADGRRRSLPKEPSVMTTIRFRVNPKLGSAILAKPPQSRSRNAGPSLIAE
jgi:hypothetical protein